MSGVVVAKLMSAQLPAVALAPLVLMVLPGIPLLLVMVNVVVARSLEFFRAADC